MMCSTRLAAVSIACASAYYAAADARADLYFSRSVGDLVITDQGPPVTTGSMNTFIIESKGDFGFAFIVIDFTIMHEPTQPDRFDATFFFASEAGDVLGGTISATRFLDADGLWSGSGEWIATDGIGAYEGWSGSGSVFFSASPADMSSATGFEGDVLIPGPAAGVVLAVLPMIRRRRRTVCHGPCL